MAVHFALGFPYAASSQPLQPIYPSYEGYTTNADGTHTLVFSYYSANLLTVELEPGPANGFLPPPEDRGQPVTFHPGRHRNVCLIVVDGGFSGNLQWTIDSSQSPVTTTERGGVDPLYLLETISSGYRAARGIDTETAPRGICINRAPTVIAGADQKVALGTGATLQGIVRDEGLPRGSSLTVSWAQVSGPGTASFANASASSTAVTFGAAGAYSLVLSASDSELSAEDTLTVDVVAAQEP